MRSPVSTIINHDVIGMDKSHWKKKTKMVKRDSVGGRDSLWTGNQTGVSLNINCFILSSKEQLVATELIFVSHHFYWSKIDQSYLISSLIGRIYHYNEDVLSGSLIVFNLLLYTSLAYTRRQVLEYVIS